MWKSLETHPDLVPGVFLVLIILILFGMMLLMSAIEKRRKAKLETARLPLELEKERNLGLMLTIRQLERQAGLPDEKITRFPEIDKQVSSTPSDPKKKPTKKE